MASNTGLFLLQRYKIIIGYNLCRINIYKVKGVHQEVVDASDDCLKLFFYTNITILPRFSCH